MEYDIAIIGAGPGGYVAAIRSAQLGFKTLLVEKEAVGGVCLNWGCIPTKAMIKNAEVLQTVKSAHNFGISISSFQINYQAGMERVWDVVRQLTNGINGLLKKHQVDLVFGDASLVDDHTISVNNQHINSHSIILATGASPNEIPGIEVDGRAVVNYKNGLLDQSPPDNAIVLGGGAIGIESAWFLAAYGSKVTVIETEDRILPREDKEISRYLTRYLEKQSFEILSNSQLVDLTKQENNCDVSIATANGTRYFEDQRVIVAAGIHGNTNGIGLENIKANISASFIQVDKHLRVNESNVYAIGDLIGYAPLAHVAQAQAIYVVEQIAGLNPSPINYGAVPRAVYCHPQVASIGMTEEEAINNGFEIKVGRFPMAANGKALAEGSKEGFAKVVVDSKNGEILGSHLLGSDVTELLGELSIAKILDGTNLEIGNLINAHPSISEVVKEAALAVDGNAIHV